MHKNAILIGLSMKSIAVLIEDGVFALFSSLSLGIWRLKCPRPWEFAIKDKKCLCWEERRVGVGGGRGELQLTDAMIPCGKYTVGLVSYCLL